MAEAGSVQTMSVVGAGVMGMGIVQIAALAGVSVRVFDVREGSAKQGVEKLAQTLRTLQEKGKLKAEAVDAAIGRIHAATALSDLKDSDVVVEAIVEDLKAKQALFADLEALVREDAILATNTSSLSVTSIAAGMKRPQRVAGFHFFNPVPLMKVVEVIDGLLTDRAVTDTLLVLGTRMGHTAVRAKDTPGFIVNHAGRGYNTEALRLVSEGVCGIPEADAVLREVAGFRLGPFELMDMTALDVSHPVMESIYHQFYEEPRFRPNPLTRQMLSAGLVGRKVGRGFYVYEGGQKQPVPEAPVPAVAKPAAVWLAPDAPQALVNLIDALGTRDTGAKPGADSLIVVAPIGDDATTVAIALGLDASRTVGIESLFDLSRRRVVMTTPATTKEWRDAAHVFFAADGQPVTVIRDSAGLVAQRVVATIVNIACDIAQQRIATPADIDRAVSLGLNYPFPPLAWGDRLGPRTVLSILERMESFYGDPRYRASPWLKRRASLGLSLLQDET
jgi:3-hydroxybutyryl-CoA dehydrogenase